MLMSIFSSFDALSPESVGQKVCLSRASSPYNKQDAAAAEAAVKIDDLEKKGQEDSAAAKIDDLKKKGQEVNCSSQPMKDGRRVRAPRFAPELDGIHCFETIIPY